MPCSLTPAEPSRQAIAASGCCRPFHYVDDLSKTCISRLHHTASVLAVYASQVSLRCHPRKTRFWLVANLYQAGLTPAGSQSGKFPALLTRVYITFPLPQALPGAQWLAPFLCNVRVALDEANEIADKFAVSWAVVKHQLENHRIAEIIPN